MTRSMDPATVWLVMIAIGAGTYLLRLSFLHLAGRLPASERLNRALRFVPAAVLSALVAPAIVPWAPGAGGLAVEDLPRLLAGIAAAVVAWTTHGVFATLIVGMGTLWGLSFLLS